MKKIYALALAAVLSATGCSDTISDFLTEPVTETAASVSSSAEIESSDTDKESPTEKLSPRDREVNTDEEHVFDFDGTLSSKELSDLNSYAAWLEKTLKICVSVVITDDLEDSSPHEYAESYYAKLYKSQAGLMLLVNNETGNDVIYRKGYVSKFIGDKRSEELLIDMSPLLVTGNVGDAAEILFAEAELTLPSHASDRSGKLSKDQLDYANSLIGEAVGEDNVAVIYTSSPGEIGIDPYAEELFARFFDEKEDSALLAVDTKTGDSCMIGSGKYSGISDMNKLTKNSFKNLLKKTDDKTEYDVKKAAEMFVSVLEG